MRAGGASGVRWVVQRGAPGTGGHNGGGSRPVATMNVEGAASQNGKEVTLTLALALTPQQRGGGGQRGISMAPDNPGPAEGSATRERNKNKIKINPNSHNVARGETDVAEGSRRQKGEAVDPGLARGKQLRVRGGGGPWCVDAAV